uniref:Uncharacterized protein n=1 Tax=Aegilops tauschii subsp. strangulata TaxID=200361 RepID=A0A453IKX7_AEGTS
MVLICSASLFKFCSGSGCSCTRDGSPETRMSCRGSPSTGPSLWCTSRSPPEATRIQWVRLYSPKRLFQQLEAAKEEFIRGNVGVRGSGRGRSRVILPKVLESYARDAGLAAQELLRVVEPCLPEG